VGVFFVFLRVPLFFSERLRAALDLFDVFVDIHALSSVDHNEKLLCMRPNLGARSGPDELFNALPILSVEF
jgi:hypothetical protein